MTDYHKIAENVYLDGKLAESGVEINGDDVRNYIKSELEHLENTKHDRHRSGVAACLVGCVVAFVTIILLVLNPPELRYVVCLAGVIIIIMPLFYASIIIFADIRDHKDYTIRRLEHEAYLITPIIKQPPAIAIGKFST